eukprot:scaffold1402_cov204-Ochromonas_danica.AAC.2
MDKSVKKGPPPPPPPPPSSHFSCYIMPLKSNASVDDSLKIQEGSHTIRYHHYPQGEQEQEEEEGVFPFHSLYPTPQHYAKSAYSTTLAPLVRGVVAGESSLVVYGGVHSAHVHSGYLLSHTTMQGLLAQATNQLLHSVNTEEEGSGSSGGGGGGSSKTGRVTFSWYRIDCDQSEGVVDVLKAASTHATSSSSTTTSSSTSLILREAGRGRGMMVPGLWEVEVASGQDVEAVVGHVTQALPMLADYHQEGQGHTIMQLIVKNPKINKGGEEPGLGRLTFLLMGSMSPSSSSTTTTTSSSSPTTSARVYPWVEQCQTIAQWVTSQRPSPPFHKSRLLLLLRDALLKRQRVVYTLLLLPSRELHDANLHWLYLFHLLAGYTVSEESLPSSSRGGVAGGGGGGGGGRAGGSSKRAATPTNRRPTLITPTTPRGVTTSSSSTTTMGRAEVGGAGGGEVGVLKTPSSSSYGRRWEESLLEISPLPRAAIDYPLPPPPPPPPATTPRSSSSNTTTATSTTTTRRRGSLSIATTTNGVVDSHTPPPPPPAPPTTTTASLSGDGYHLPDHLVSSHETEAALSLALEASRNEASALRIAYTYANEKYQEVKLAYNTLLDQIQEEGSMLTKRDQERYRLALKDLADYEIYKQVMEAAMVKLNNELACYVKENDHLKLMRQQEERERSRQKVGQEKYGKDLVATKKKLAELEARLPHDEKKVSAIGLVLVVEVVVEVVVVVGVVSTTEVVVVVVK